MLHFVQHDALHVKLDASLYPLTEICFGLNFAVLSMFE
jgi:hypothetical protein